MSRRHQHTINIVYVKGAVDNLLPFLSTLLNHSSCDYQLVSNGCTRKEEQTLKDYCHKRARCSFLSLGQKQMALHHDVLNQLVKLDDSPYFAFLDSDMLVTGPFIDDWLSKLDDYDAVFTGLPIWQSNVNAKMPENFKIMGGRYLWNHQGSLLGISFGAAYRRQGLQGFINDSGISFDRCHFNNLPGQYQSLLKERALDKYFYDTGKLLNILWQHQGAKMAYFDSDSLYHVGGVSALIHLNLSGAKKWYNTVRSALPIYIRASLKRRRTGMVVSFAESLDMEVLLKKKRAIKALLLNDIFGTRIGMVDKMYVRSLDKNLVFEVQKMAKSIKELVPDS